jgi:long-chain acyl-CoA synthetase
MKAGGVVVPTSILRSADGLLHEAGSSGSRILITQPSRLEVALGIREQANLEHILLVPEAEEVSKQRPMPKGVIEFYTLIEENDPLEQEAPIEPQEDLCELSFTGGATGTPKGVMITHAIRCAAIQQFFPWVMKPLLRGIAGKASTLIAIPLFHSYGHYAHQASANIGLRVIILPDPRDTNALVETIDRHRPLLIPGVPTQFMRIAEAGLTKLNSMLISGSAPLPQEIAQKIKQMTGMPVSEGYALTETSSISHFNVSAFSKITGFMPKEKPGIGIPVPDTECVIIDPETDRPASTGSPGEIVLRGPQVMRGYWPNPGDGLTEDGWLHTGDIAVMDEDGYFQIIDRIKDMVNVSGMKVYTTKVDEVLFKHPAVLMAAAFGVPDPQLPGSERVMAVIKLKADYKGAVTAEDIQNFCRAHLDAYAVPRYVDFQDELPLTVTEKLFKKQLREQAIARMRAKQE